MRKQPDAPLIFACDAMGLVILYNGEVANMVLESLAANAEWARMRLGQCGGRKMNWSWSKEGFAHETRGADPVIRFGNPG